MVIICVCVRDNYSYCVGARLAGVITLIIAVCEKERLRAKRAKKARGRAHPAAAAVHNAMLDITTREHTAPRIMARRRRDVRLDSSHNNHNPFLLLLLLVAGPYAYKYALCLTDCYELLLCQVGPATINLIFCAPHGSCLII